MKTIKRVIVLLILLTMCFALACTRTPIEDNEATDRPTETTAEITDAPGSDNTEAPTEAPTPTQKATEAPTEAPTPTNSPVPSTSQIPLPTPMVHTIGQVKYSTVYKYSFDNDFPDNLLGTVVNLQSEGTENVIKTSNVSIDKDKTWTAEKDWQEYEQSQLTIDRNPSEGGRISVECFAGSSKGHGLTVTLDFAAKQLLIEHVRTPIDFTPLLPTGGTMKFNIICTHDGTVYVYVVKKLAAKIVVGSGNLKVVNGSNTTNVNLSGKNVNSDGRRWLLKAENSKIEITRINVYNSGKGAMKMSIEATPTGNNKLGLDITNKTDLVGICYTMWFNAIFGNGTGEIKNVPNVSELLKEYKFSKEKGFYKDNGATSNKETAFHFWAEPAQGYYRSTDKQAHRNNLTLLAAANVDFLVLDYTFAQAPTYAPGTSAWRTYIDGPMNALLDTIMEMRAEGKKTPYVVLWPNDDTMFGYMQQYYLNQKKWEDCFVYWNGNPFILRWQAKKLDYDGLTVRAMYGLQGRVSTGQWSFLEIDNSKTVSYDKNGNPEHMTCCVASQRNYMSYTDMAEGRDGGKFWNKQWKNVFNVHPKIVTLTWWNEWAAQLYNIPGAGYIFTDNFNQEYSRDIEPMKGGHGDQYYKWLIEYVKAYKNHEKCPELYEK